MEVVRRIGGCHRGSRTRRAPLLALVALALAGCGGLSFLTGGPGWRGPDVHLVGDTWVGTERPCDEKDTRCRTIVALALRAVPAEIGSAATRIVLVDLPTEYVMDSGEVRRVRLAAGIDTRVAVVVDLRTGARQAIGLRCYLPSYGDGTFAASAATCNLAPLDEWRDGNVPPSIPTDVSFG